MNLYQQMINKKMKSMTVDELLKYSKQYRISITKDEARKIVKMIRDLKTNVNIFDVKERKELLKKVAKITSPKVAKQLNTLFINFTK